MRIGSLFSGAGGLDIAVQEVFGGEVIWHAEIDKAASKVLAYRYPGVPNLGDITQINWENWKPLLEIDILCAGFPCQDVSAAGKRAGLKEGTRSGLWSHVAEAIYVLRPPIVVLENVRGLLSATAHRTVESDEAALGDGTDGPVLRAIGAVVGDLADRGYVGWYATVAAGDVGAPHRRERVFILATDATGERRPGSIKSQPILVNDRPEPTHVGEAGGVVDLLPTPRSSDCFGAGQHGDGGMDLRTTISLLPTPRSHRRGDCESERNRKDPDLEATTHHFPAGQWGKYEPAIRRWESLTRPAPAPTEPNKNGNPRLSAAFSEWMLGWPAGWVTDPAIGISRNDQLRIVGNGVCPQQAAQALRLLLRVAAGAPSAVVLPKHDTGELLPTPCVVDRLATTDMTLEQWDESRRSQKERGVGSTGPRGDSLGAAVLRVEEGTVDDRPDYSTRGARA